MRIGIDLGGTKTEALALDEGGRELARHRVATPRDYGGSVRVMVELVGRLERECGERATVGVGMPGTLRADGLVKNANSTWLNGRPLQSDLSAAMGREVRVANDANCLAVSEATDGAGQGMRTVFAVILGTGCGGGLAVDGRLHGGPNGTGGEWGHNPLPWARAEELPGPACYCGRSGCLEKWVAGPAVEADYFTDCGRVRTMREIAAACAAGEPEAMAAVERLEDRLGRGLAALVNVLDPDVIVFGGGLSRVERLYARLPAVIRAYTFGREFETPLRPAVYGDSSGVRGAAWLWPPQTGADARRSRVI